MVWRWWRRVLRYNRRELGPPGKDLHSAGTQTNIRYPWYLNMLFYDTFFKVCFGCLVVGFRVQGEKVLQFLDNMLWEHHKILTMVKAVLTHRGGKMGPFSWCRLGFDRNICSVCRWRGVRINLYWFSLWDPRLGSPCHWRSFWAVPRNFL